MLLVFIWIATDNDTTRTTETSDEPNAAATPTPDPITPEPTGQDRTAAGTAPPENEPSNSAENDDGDAAANLTGQITALRVADDERGGYDRDDFGDYDRDALLEESLREHGCYLSLADDQCYDDASEVHADHIVSVPTP